MGVVLLAPILNGILEYCSLVAEDFVLLYRLTLFPVRTTAIHTLGLQLCSLMSVARCGISVGSSFPRISANDFRIDVSYGTGSLGM